MRAKHIIFFLLVAVACLPAQAQYRYQSFSVTVSKHTDVPVRLYAARVPQAVSLLWLPSERGFQQNEYRTAESLAKAGISVYFADLHSAYFVTRNSRSIDQFDAQEMAALVDRLGRRAGGRLVLVSSGKGVIAVLRAMRQWQLRHASSGADKALVQGAVLISGKYFRRTPEPGMEGEFYPVVASTSLPLVMIQPVKSPWYWKLSKTVPVLSRGGSPVFVRTIAGIRDRFYFRPDATPLERRTGARLALILRRAVGLLKPYAGRVFAAAPEPAAKAGKPRAASRRRGRSLSLFRGNPVPPALDLEMLSGRRMDLQTLKQHVVLVNFWASWCPPCVHEMPSMQKLSDRFNGRRFRILAVNMGEGRDVIKAFLQQKVSVSFPILLDLDGKALSRWKVYAFPTSYLIGKKGRIRYAVFGAIDWSAPAVAVIVEKLLAE